VETQGSGRYCFASVGNNSKERVPFLVKWPGKIKPGTVSNGIQNHEDAFATLAAAGYMIWSIMIVHAKCGLLV
jgi:hypothetical protein